MKPINGTTLIVKILALEKIIYNNNTVDMLVLPGLDGVLAVLPQHLPMLVVLKFGIVEVHYNDRNIDRFTISGGIAKVDSQVVDIISMFAMNCTYIDKLKIKARIDEINAVTSLKQNTLLQEEHKFLIANLELLS
ncbi:FoF1 ATP synthase subunit delta/epsilon [Orientia tsutsugamushi]|uniref:FoF1 ATP synthase subunit delta/epsilon n=1 Tax=Orientia tsutsugamushi TaxID=784 RepID=UPI003528A3F9